MSHISRKTFGFLTRSTTNQALQFAITALFSSSLCQIYRVTDEALIAETAVWPNFFLMNVFFPLNLDLNFLVLCVITAAGCYAVWRL